MRFVKPMTKTIHLTPGPGGEPRWIEVKLDLTAAEQQQVRNAGFGRLSRRAEDTDRTEIEIDWAAMAFARAEAYLVDWSAAHVSRADERVPLSPAAIRALHPDDFAEIDEAIKQHIEEREAGKGQTTSAPSSTATARSSEEASTGPGTTTVGLQNTSSTV